MSKNLNTGLNITPLSGDTNALNVSGNILVDTSGELKTLAPLACYGRAGFGASTYGIGQTSAYQTNVNAASGQRLFLLNNNVEQWSVGGDGKWRGSTAVGMKLAVYSNAGTDEYGLGIQANEFQSILSTSVGPTKKFTWVQGTSSSHTEHMVLTDKGRLGINSTLPSAKLHVVGSGTTSAGSALLIENSGGVDIFKIENDGGFSLGYNTTPNTKASVIIGDAAVAHFQQATIIGDGATDGGGSFVGGIVTAVGAGAQATINGAVAIGGNTAASTSASAVAIGNGAISSGGTAIGQSAKSNGNGVSIGTSSTSIGANGGTAVGLSATATGTQSTAVGRSASATGSGGCVAIGNSANAAGSTGSISVGYLSEATGATSISIGMQSKANTTRSIAIGRLSESTGIESIAIGYESEILSVSNSLAVGPGAAVTAAGSQMLGWRTGPNVNKTTNSVANSFGLGWDTATPDVLFAKTADSYIAGTGDLGIGIKTPTAKLHIEGNGSGTGNAFLIEDTNGVDRLLVQDNGNVGFGVTPSSLTTTSEINVAQGDFMQFDSPNNSDSYGGLKFIEVAASFNNYGGLIFYQGNSTEKHLYLATQNNGTIGGGITVSRTDGRVQIFKAATAPQYIPTAQCTITGANTGTSYALEVGDSGGTIRFKVRNDGRVNMGNLPTSATGLATGDLWNNSGVINIV